MRTFSQSVGAILLGSALALGASSVSAQEAGGDGCQAIAAALEEAVHSALQDALDNAVDGMNAGLSNQMWGTIVDRDGIVCAVAFTGGDRGDQWPGSRVISAQKANTANAFSLPSDAGFGGALSSGNLYGQTLPGGSLFELPESNPVDTASAYGGDAADYGAASDPMVSKKIGGVNVFGGGLALYDEDSGVDEVLGGLGVSGDTSCTDHVVAWRTRFELGLDLVPGGVSATSDDNLIIKENPKPNTFEHPDCGGGVKQIIKDLPDDFPIGGD
jgi:uncharacterized protein GlcG (DUF336 family)